MDHAGFVLGLFFDPEDEGDMFLRNVGWLLTAYMALYPRRQNSSKTETLGEGETRPLIRGGAPGQDCNIIFASLRLKSGRGSQEGLDTKTDGLTDVNRNMI
jgi:hypothetical protein